MHAVVKRLNSDSTKHEEKRQKRHDNSRSLYKSKENEDVELQRMKCKLVEETKQLPIFKQKKKLQKLMKSLGMLVIVGETGSGKTTQVPKYMYQANINNHKCIAVTQPRRVAAITLATRVAMEMGSRLGDKVGYNVRFDNMSHPESKIIFLTDGMLLREALLDPLLSRYGVVVLDEAHERTVESDVLFGIVKKAQWERENNVEEEGGYGGGEEGSDEDGGSGGGEEGRDEEGGDKKGNINDEGIDEKDGNNDNDAKTNKCNVGVVNQKSRIEDMMEKNFRSFKRKKNIFTPLKVLVMSATMDVHHFSSYFNEAHVVEVPGRQHHIEILYLLSKLKTDYLDASLETVAKIHLKAPANEDILVFLTGQEEIEQAVRQMRSKLKDFKRGLPGLIPLPFYSSLPQHLQMKVFEPTPPGLRKVVFSTNLAETSLTITGIRYVVDPGKTKNRSYNPVIGLDQLKIEPTSQAQANQRAGRAGRECDGVCYRLYSKEEFQSFREVPIPEILRRNLSGIILQLVFMGIQDVLSFDFMDKPSPESIRNGVKVLKWLNAITEKDGLLELTADGHKMTSFPLDPQFSRVILQANTQQCLSEVLTIISMLSADSIYINSSDERQKITEARESFEDSSGDLLMLLNLAKKFKKQTHKKEWCEEHYINFRSMGVAMEIREQLKQLCLMQGLKIGSGRGQEGSDVEIRKCFLSGFFMNTARYLIDSYITTSEGRQVTIHPSCCLYKNPTQPESVLFIELVDTNDIYMRNICSVDFDWIKEIAPPTFKIKPMRRPDNNEVKNRIQVKKMQGIKDRMMKSLMKKEMKRMKKK